MMWRSSLKGRKGRRCCLATTTSTRAGSLRMSKPEKMEATLSVVFDCSRQAERGPYLDRLLDNQDGGVIINRP